MEAVLEVSGLTKRYAGIVAVDGLTFEVHKGESFGLLGPNGAGKTTTIRLLTGQIRPTSGTINVAGFDITRDATKAKEHVGIVPDISNLYDEMSAWDNLIFSAQLYGVQKKERMAKAKELLELFDLHDRRDDRVGKFSRGMKRRVAIAAALIHEPKILFLDEPTTGLDVQSARMIRELIQELNKKGTTVFLTTHYITEADQLCERVAIINRGKVIAMDSPEKLKSTVEKGHVIEICFDRAGNWVEHLGRLNHVTGVTRVGDKFRVFVDGAPDVIPTLVDFSREHALNIVSINTVTPSLEDAFVRIAGLSPDIMGSEKEPAKKDGG